MKVLDVDLLHDGLTRNMNRMTRLEQEMTAILQSVEELVALDDALKGEGGQAIRDFYQHCHVPFLQYFLVFKQEFHAVLEQARHALASLEPSDAGHMVETFLDGDVQEGLNRSANITRELTDEANAIMDSVSDIVGLPYLDDSRVQVSIIDAKRKRDETLEALYLFDQTQTNQLASIETSIQSMKEWVQNIEGMFTQGLTDVNFPSKQWSSMTVGSDITMKLTAMGLSVGRFLSPQEAAQLIEQSIKQKVIDDEDLDIAGAYYTLEDGRIVRAFYSPSGAVMYTFVKKIPKQKKVEKEPEVQGKWGFLDFVHLGLDVVGLIPVVGEAADLINGTIYTIKGDKVNATLSFVSAVPFVGYTGTAGKVVYKSTDVIGVKNVINPKKLQPELKNTYKSVVNGPISNTQTYMAIYNKNNYLQIPPNQFNTQISQSKIDLNTPLTKNDVSSDTKGVSKASPAEVAQSWQGSFPYVGVDKYKNISLKKGKVIYVGDPYPTGYATTKSALDRIDGDARKLFEGLQVKPYWEDGMDVAEYRSKMMAYEITEPIDVAFGITKANPQFGSGGLPQMFLPDFKELLSSGKIKKVELKAVELKNNKIQLDDYNKMLDVLEGLKEK